MYYALFAIHLVLSLMLCVVVLLQQSKGGGLAGAFGGAGAGEAMFGARGVTTLLHKATIYLAIAFMITSLGLVFATARRGGTSESTLSSQAAQRIPVTPAPLPVEGGTDDGLLPILPAGDEAGGAAADDSAAGVPESGEGAQSQDESQQQKQDAGGGR